MSIWHKGEQAIQTRLDGAVRPGDAERGPLRARMTEQHRDFFAARPFVALGGLDGQGRPWAGIATGTPGFVHSPDPARLGIRARLSPADALYGCLKPEARLGILGIDFTTRRRNRVNGRIISADPDGICLAVDQAFGNCPKYIRNQDIGALTARTDFAAHSSTELDADAKALIGRTESFFVASWSGDDETGTASGLDISHRGGPAGFVRFTDDGGILVPDYAGNRYFNTLGNMLNTGVAGVLFIDFATGARLQATGTTRIVWDDPDVEALEGAERAWRFTPTLVTWMR
jgi:predicted pyridoxine 5'-phosphate oxidase superfamily flavin-nucleotide-binding protein